MSSVQQVESSVRELSESELAEFRTWFAEFDAPAWDDQFERDVAAGRLDALADAALIDLRNGKCRQR
jgi:hypothetical protein